ncbi:TetR/AcrR family transcriptional regulator [Vibrio sp. WXL103]|uniref:TetR/AcrR family transcriptional regulator n=1 Tax=Vibrio sp. WXL103 TaxID=3450710 RepID=UPI003EC4CE09
MTVTKKSRSELKREAILEAARASFLEFGVANTSMDKVSAMAGVSKRTVYNHFASKEALVLALLSCLWSNPDALSEDDLSQEHDLKLQLTDLVFQQIKKISDPAYIELSRVAFGHYLFRPEELKQQVAALDKQQSVIYQWLEYQSKHKRIALEETQIALVAEQLYSLLKGSAYWPQLMGICDPLDDQAARKLAQQTVELFWARYGQTA